MAWGVVRPEHAFPGYKAYRKHGSSDEGTEVAPPHGLDWEVIRHFLLPGQCKVG